MIILITNDDGIDAPGLTELASAAEDSFADAEIWVVAPSEQQSGCSRGMSLHSPLRVRERGENRFAVTGTPTDCVFLAVHQLLPRKPDLVLSGINAGANLGDDVCYSGTAAAAAEAATLGIPALAASLAIDFASEDVANAAWSTARQCVRSILPHVLQHAASGAYFNVNIPNRALEDVGGIRVCRLGRRRYKPHILYRLDAMGRPYYWLSAMHDGFAEGADADGNVLNSGAVTLTPVGLEVTADDQFEAAKQIAAQAVETSRTRLGTRS